MDELCSAPGCFASLSASGLSVGLPRGVMGNSEVGHLTLGAGSVLKTDIVRINEAIEKDTLGSNEALSLLASGKKDSALHFVGLCSKSSVHSHLDHLKALLEVCAAKELPFKRIVLHLVTDGRDSPPKSAKTFVAGLFSELAAVRKRLKVDLFVGSFGGRYYYMDRDKRAERTKLAFAAIVNEDVLTETTHIEALAESPVAWENSEKLILERLEASYAEGVTDEFVKPTKVGRALGANFGDTVFFFNFRADRMRQITTSFLPSAFPGLKNPFRVFTMTSFAEEFADQVHVVFPLQFVQRPLAERVSEAGLEQLHVAETEKYAHVTYFFNGRKEQAFVLEKRVLVDSPKHVPTYDLVPRMAMAEVTDRVVAAVRDGPFSLIVLNLAAPDMVGHTGKLEAVKEACEVCDEQIGRIRACCKENGWVFAVTADHGNAEVMLDPETGEAVTSHTCNEVPFAVEGTDLLFARNKGTLADVAPTVAQLLGVDFGGFEGTSLLS